jgi:hypothetical protein
MTAPATPPNGANGHDTPGANGNGAKSPKRDKRTNRLRKPKPSTKLTAKQRAFCIEYAKCWNGTKAARLAGYNGDDKSLAQIAFENLRKLGIKKFVEGCWKVLQVGADQALARVSEIANCNPADFMDDDGRFSLEKLRELGYLVKKVKSKVLEADGQTVTSIEEIEMHDALSSLDKILRAHKIIGSSDTIININFVTILKEAGQQFVPPERMAEYLRFVGEQLGKSANN